MLTLAFLEADVQVSIGDLQLSTTTFSLDNRHLARGGSLRCKGSHKRYVRMSLRGSIRPNRLLKIIYVGGNIVLRIVETGNLPLDEEYITGKMLSFLSCEWRTGTSWKKVYCSLTIPKPFRMRS